MCCAKECTWTMRGLFQVDQTAEHLPIHECSCQTQDSVRHHCSPIFSGSNERSKLALGCIGPAPVRHEGRNAAERRQFGQLTNTKGFFPTSVPATPYADKRCPRTNKPLSSGLFLALGLNILGWSWTGCGRKLALLSSAVAY